MDDTVPAIELRKVSKIYSVKTGLFARTQAPALTDVDLIVKRKRVLGLVGESGSGKTTIAKLMLGLLAPTSGEVLIDGASLGGLSRRKVAERIQLVFQDPFSSLNPRRSVEEAVAHPLRLHGIGNWTERLKRARKLLELVGLPARVWNAMPSQLSGGQRQRVVIARALVMSPEIVVCDEPTSALDVSVQAQILNLLSDLREELGLTYVFISHNLEVIRHVATEVAVIYRGQIVEAGPCAAIFDKAEHAYTRRLLGSVMSVAPGAGVPSLSA